MKKSLGLMTMLYILLLLTGCSPVEKTLENLVNGEKTPTTKEKVYSGDKTGNDAKGAKIAPQEVGGAKGEINNGVAAPGKNNKPGTTREKVNIVLYFTNSGGESLVKENRTIPKVQGLARASIEELLKGPQGSSKLKNPIPKGTKLRDINIKPDGLAIVDLSREFKVNHPGGSGSEILTVYAVVNTLTQFQSVSKVLILIEGEGLESLAGHVDISKPLQRDSSMIKTVQ
ncbi:MAG: GerMN domain-containing protein [Clostridia bacterium]|nr:GerMN domain-containing protein [Clostridia bacterium]